MSLNCGVRTGGIRKLPPLKTVRGRSTVLVQVKVQALGGSQPPRDGDTASPMLSRALVMATTIAACGCLTIGNALSVTNEQLLFLEAWRAVDRAYVDKSFNGQSWFKVREDWLKREKMGDRQQTYDAIKRLLQLLNDPFTRFLTPEQYSALRNSTSGSVTGVGVEVSFQQASKAVSKTSGKGPSLVVLSSAPGSPAERAGIRAGDEIITIDGQDVTDMSLYAVGNMLQGPEGTTVVLTISPGGNGTTSMRSVSLVRQPIKFNPVDDGLCTLRKDGPSNKVGYLRVASFSKQTTEKFMTALKQMTCSNETAAIVLDFRNNGGGLFPAAVEIARMLINQGDIVLIADSMGVKDVYEANGNAVDTTTPIIMLVNKGTASASEVLAGALKDDNRAVIVGENTFGKGLIQTVVPLSDGSALAVTVAKYQTPSGVDINKVGIEPNVRLDIDSLNKIPMQSTEFCKWIDGDKDGELKNKLFK